MDITKFHHYFAAIIRTARLHANLTQVEVASRAGVTRRYIQSVENGKQEAALSTLFALAEAMEVSPVKLVADLENAIRDNRLPDDMLDALPPQKLGRPAKNVKSS